MRERCRALDWSATPLGPPGRWPAALRSTAQLVVAHCSRRSCCGGPRSSRSTTTRIGRSWASSKAGGYLSAQPVHHERLHSRSVGDWRVQTSTGEGLRPGTRTRKNLGEARPLARQPFLNDVGGPNRRLTPTATLLGHGCQGGPSRRRAWPADAPLARSGLRRVRPPVDGAGEIARPHQAARCPSARDRVRCGGQQLRGGDP